MLSKPFDRGKMSNSSREVASSQTGVHQNLKAMVKKHQVSLYKKPIQAHNRAAFDEFLSAITQSNSESLILDSCCGTGMSTYMLAAQNPGTLVIGIDQSINRLRRKANYKKTPNDNVLLLQANCEDFWRLCVSQNICFAKHFILYPNPYPKPGQLSRRWHGHPVFSSLPALSKSLEVRSNWAIYIKEFAAAWCWLTQTMASVNEIEFDESMNRQPLTLFEKKYRESGQRLWQLKIDQLEDS